MKQPLSILAAVALINACSDSFKPNTDNVHWTLSGNTITFRMQPVYTVVRGHATKESIGGGAMKPYQLQALALGMLCVACAHNRIPPPPPPPDATMPLPAAATVQGTQPGEAAPRSLDQMLAGKISGVQVTPLAGGGIAVRMMGPTSFNDANEGPLFIVDGTPVEVRPGGALPWINPRDIESITALKNPADIAIYGVRGANGVIVIKTKQGNPR